MRDGQVGVKNCRVCMMLRWWWLFRGACARRQRERFRDGKIYCRCIRNGADERENERTEHR